MEIAVTAGRQLLLFGNQRLIGPLDWTNSSRSFDAIRFEIRPHEKVKLDVVTSSVVINSPERRINHHKDGVNFHGAYASVEIGNRHSIEPFLLWRTAGDVSGEQGASGSLDRYSAGIRAVGTVLESVNYDVTVVSQWGELASQPIDAQASTVRLEYRLPLSRNLRVSAGYDFASGDEDETDGRIGWFDDMYPTAHLYYGYNDLVGWRNIRTVRFGTAIELFSGTEATVDFHRFWLDTGSDYLYDAAGRPSFRFPESAGSSLRVGDEIDFTLGYRATPTLTATGGIGRTLPGSLLAAATPGASHTFVYVSLAQAF